MNQPTGATEVPELDPGRDGPDKPMVEPGRKAIGSLLFAIGAAFVFMSGYQWAKGRLLPDSQILQSELLTVLLTATLATLLTYFALQRRVVSQQRRRRQTTDSIGSRGAEELLKSQLFFLQNQDTLQNNNICRLNIFGLFFAGILLK